MIAQILVCTALALVEDRPSSSVTGIDVSVEATRKSIERGLEALYAAQQENGSFGAIRTLTFNSYFANPATYHCWQIGASALATQAILQVGEGEKAVAAVDRGLDYLVKNAKVIRPAEWDIDNNWSLIYGLTTLAAAIGHPRYAGSAREPELREAAAMMIAGLKEYQGARGGWGYYADPDANWRPDWATSFTTAAALIALLDAEAVGLAVDPKVKAAAIRAVERSRLPNGSYDYDIGAVPRHLTLESINQVKGSLGRIQICNHALLRAGVDLGPDAVAVGVEQFFEHHKFLAVARHKPIPHEAYYANAAYFYLFGHYYAAFTIERLPESERPGHFAQLRAKVLECQNDDGSFWDFWIADLAKSYGTAFAIMALDKSLTEHPSAPDP
jgi:hypothetical protein